MRNLKFSLALFVAFAAVSIAMISKASVLTGKARIVGCFTTITLTDITGALSISPVVDLTDCGPLRTSVSGGSAFYLKAISSPSAVSTAPCTQDVDFCCVELEPTADNPNVPTFNLGDNIQQKYQIVDKDVAKILCRP